MADITITVTTLDDTTNGVGISLRDAIATVNANAGSADNYTIEFDSSLQPASGTESVITLTQGQITISNDVIIDGDIDGDGRADIVIQAAASPPAPHRIFNIDGDGSNIQIELNSLVLENGSNNLEGGGAVFVGDDDTLIARAVTFQNNEGARGGALLLSEGAHAEIHDSVFLGNESAGSGGAIYADDADDLTIVNTTFYRNESTDSDTTSASAIYSFDTNLTILNSTLVQNGLNEAVNEGEYVALVVDDGSVEIKNTIISGNGSGSTSSAADNVRYENLDFSKKNQYDVGFNLIGADPANIFEDFDQFARSDADDDVATLVIQDGGEAHDTGGNSEVTTEFDARGDGNFRTVGDVVDIGAYEIPGSGPYFVPVLVDIDEFDLFGNTATVTITENTAQVINTPYGTEIFDVDAVLNYGDTVDDSISYTIVSGNDNVDGDQWGPFAIDSNTGVITVVDERDLDYDLRSSFTLEIEASGGGETTTANVTINLQDLAETFVVTTLDDEFDVGYTLDKPGGEGLSLREALEMANAGVGSRDTIVFADDLEGTIRLKADQDPNNDDDEHGWDYSNSDFGELIYARNVIIDGDNRITISGDTSGNDLTTMHGDIEVTDLSQMAVDSTLLADNVGIFVDTGSGANLSTATVFKGLTLTGGVAVDGGGNGGAINAGGQQVVVQDSLLIGNQATTRGGAVWGNSGQLVILDSTITGNRAGTNSSGDGGGGISHSTANWGGLTVVNSTITNNYAVGDGGGISLVYAGGTVKESLILNSTITGNYSAEDGGGIQTEIDLTIANSLILGNAAGGTDNEIKGNNWASYSGKNLIGVPNGDFDASGIVEVDNAALADVFAALQAYGVSGVTGGALADHGGPVWTVALKDSATNPALDGGDDTMLSEATLGLDINADGDTNDTLDHDARGGTRPVDAPNAPNNGASTTDIGAFELEPSAPTDLDLINVNSVDENDDAGVDIGDVTVTDEDTTNIDDFTFTLSDDRFEVVGDELRLKAGEALDYDVDGANVSLTITVTDPDDQRYSETFYIVVNNVNEAPTGGVTIDGTVPLGWYSANASTLDDPDGISGPLAYQWQSSTDGTSWTDVVGATSATYRLSDADVGRQLQVVVSYTDDGGTVETVTSAAKDVVSHNVVELSAPGTRGLVFEGQRANDRLGFSVSDAGDVNGDGFDDVIVGAWGADPNGSSSGWSYVLFGNADGTVADLADVENGTGGGFVINGALSNDLSGWSVSGAGDVNGDGLDDVMVAAPGKRIKSYVVFGKADGTPVELSDVENGTGGFAISGTAKSVSNAGDVNGDGLDDVIVGTGSGAGKSYVVFGKADGSEVTLADIAADADDGGFVINGASGGDYSGWSVSDAGDVNGDGLDDLIVGAWGADPDGKSIAGSSYVVFGKTDGSAVDLSDIEAGIGGGFVINGAGRSDYSGKSVSSAGDVNGDGLDDLIIGAASADPNGSSSGSSYVVFGKADGTAVELSDIEAGNGGGFVINGADRADYSGMSVSGAGDVNGDGLDDLIIGAQGADPNGSASGATYVVFGKADETAVELSDIESGIGGFVINGANGVDFSGYSVSGAGDVNGDGFDDLLVGAPYADPNGSSSGSSYIVYGGDFTNTATQIGSLGDVDDTLTATDGADVLFGGAGDDTFEDLSDGDRVYGGQGADIFRFAADANGKVIIEDFEGGIDDPNNAGDDDRIDLRAFGVTDLSGLTITASGPGGHDTAITVNGVDDFAILLKDFSWSVLVDDGDTIPDSDIAADDFNFVPVIGATLQDQSSDEDTAVSFTLPSDAFTDADGDTLTLGATLEDGSAWPSWLAFDASTRTFSGTPPTDYNETLNIKVSASDGQTGSTPLTQTFSLVINPVNDDPAGTVTVDGAMAVGETLTANTTMLSDPDGLGTLTYQWQYSVNDNPWQDIAGATSETFMPESSHVGRMVRVVVSYTDGDGTPESVASPVRPAVVTSAELQDALQAILDAAGAASINDVAVTDDQLGLVANRVLAGDPPSPMELRYKRAIKDETVFDDLESYLDNQPGITLADAIAEVQALIDATNGRLDEDAGNPVDGKESLYRIFYDKDTFDEDFVVYWDVSKISSMKQMFWWAEKFNQDIGDWDVSSVYHMADMFNQANDFNQDIGDWDVSSVTDMAYMFFSADAFNQDIGDWDVSSVQDMRSMFESFSPGESSFDQDIGDWDITSLTDATNMLDYSGMSTDNFDKLLAGWSTDRSGVKDDGIDDIPIGVTLGAKGLTYTDQDAFDRLVNEYGWTIGNATLLTADGVLAEILEDSDSTGGNNNTNGVAVTDVELAVVAERVLQGNGTMEARYQQAIQAETGFSNPPTIAEVQDIIDAENLDLSELFAGSITNPSDFNDPYVVDWDVSAVTDMSQMFQFTENFNRAIGSWDVSSVIDMSFMFQEADAFDQVISDWDVSSVTDMSGMFYGAGDFDQAIGEWDVSSVTSMSFMFASAGAFNQDIGDWDVSSVTTMSKMFNFAGGFDQDIGDWDITKLKDASDMLDYSGMSTANFDYLLAGWSTDSSPADDDGIDDIPFGVTLGAMGLQYTDQDAFDRLTVDYGWTIDGATLDIA